MNEEARRIQWPCRHGRSATEKDPLGCWICTMEFCYAEEKRRAQEESEAPYRRIRDIVREEVRAALAQEEQA